MKYGRYQIEKEIGKGSMGVVYRAYDPEINRTVALKVLRPDRITSEAFVQRFLKEAQAIGRLSHPSMVTVYDAGRDHDTIFIAMEFLEGRSLKDVMGEQQLSPRLIRHLAVQVAEALDYAHSRGIVHRDIKPSNIMINSENQVKITDFGIAHVDDPTAPAQTVAGEILGTPEYMSPEQVMGKPVDGRSDLYSLGVILYEMVTGRRPFKRANMAATFRAILQDLPEPPETENGGDPALADLIMKSIRKNPADRYRSGKEMADPLKAGLQRRRSDNDTAAASQARTSRQRWLLFAALAVMGVAIALIMMARFAGQEAAPQAILSVDSDPSGAQVFLDADFKGKTPLQLRLGLGKYEVRVSRADYYDWQAQLQLTEAGETPLFVRLVAVDSP